jgi:uncharacterized NAD(P)/FAD-binding protein YdhS
MNPFRVAIVGAGFAGTATAIALLRHWDGPAPLRIELIERSGDVGRGIAYSTRDPRHLLNVPAAKLSALDDRPDDLVEWAGCEPDAYLGRGAYGDYVAERFDDAMRGAPGVLSRVQAEAASIEGTTVVTRGGERMPADAVVLAMGLSRPEAVTGTLGDPWDPEQVAALAGAREVLIIGTGLTMVDVTLTLSGDGRGPRITAISRTGMLSRTHLPGMPNPGEPAVQPGECATADELAARVEAACRAADDWRTVIDGLRPVTQAVWRALPPAEQERFVDRHSRKWEVHRSRMAPEVGSRIAALIAARRVRVGSGSAASVDPRGYDAVVNSAGPSWDLRRGGESFVHRLIGDGLVAPGPVGLGLRTDDEGRCGRGLYTLGALRRGELWETIAVPEIREQAEALVSTIARDAALNFSPPSRI